MHPLLTFALVACNQEKFIRQAIQCAFAQTYSPLEIILSDDGSKDDTFEIMREMTDAYHGPHKIVLNRNETNVGLARHVNQIAHLAKGELVVAAAGDDMSFPERTAVLFKAWDESGRTATCLHSRVAHVDSQGEPTAAPSWEHTGAPTGRVMPQATSPIHYVRTQQPDVMGCACAWSPALFRTFGDLPEDVVHEDNAVVLRALLSSGSILFVDTPLVHYRYHGGNLFNARQPRKQTIQEIEAQERQMRRGFARRAVMHRVFCQDLATAFQKGLISQEVFYPAFHFAEHTQRLLELQCEFMAASFVRKAKILFQLNLTELGRAQLIKLSLRLLPPRAFQRVKKAQSWFHFPFKSTAMAGQPQRVDVVCE